MEIRWSYRARFSVMTSVERADRPPQATDGKVVPESSQPGWTSARPVTISRGPHRPQLLNDLSAVAVPKIN